MSGGVEVDDRVFDPPLGDPLAGVLGLSGRVRSAGLRLLLERARGMALDTLAAPANRGFVERMTAKGIDVGPWLDGRVEIRATTVPGEEFVVRFSDDVLDVLLMGHHFQTCLSPGDVNFFSAVTNAVDVNKRAAYGRTREGRIVGRRLLALTDDGLLNPFAAYSHAGDDRFAAATDAFARDLAAAMGTFLTAQGSVSPLVLSQWYDDAAASIEGDRSLDAAEGLLSKTLHAAEPERVVEEVSELLGGRDRLRDHLTRILVLPARRSRPDLLPPVTSILATMTTGPMRHRTFLARLARGPTFMSRRATGR